MRIIPALMAASFLTAIASLSGTANADEIGRYTVEVDGQSTVFISTFITDESADGHNSDLKIMGSTTVDMIRVDGSIDPKELQPEFPYISITIGGTSLNYTNLLNIQLIDSTYEKLLLANETLGQRQIENIIVDADGSISFDFFADLVRVDISAETPIAGAPGAHVKGHYSGKIPAIKLPK